ncbi:MAG TPA: hypothetical protein VFE82_09930 [Ramlibacter sp.]|jgi:hypothetical protein|uniref:hypothetical protein n=1 Tax=Ramlibacter sp. TaxID=1917967 RepID=UPI002D2793B0|nr:hypothetical protein [Ramlibacter sp.]HZY18791.1 hypothetical protein [Ramlibacter sp.]
MWKIVVGFIVFAAIALFVIFKAGDQVDMGGEKHGVDSSHAPAPAASAAAAPAAPAPATAPAASAGR